MSHRLIIVTACDQSTSLQILRNEGLTDILVGKLVGETYPLRLVLYRLPIDYCVFELLDNGLVDSVALKCGQLRNSKRGKDQQSLLPCKRSSAEQRGCCNQESCLLALCRCVVSSASPTSVLGVHQRSIRVLS